MKICTQICFDVTKIRLSSSVWPFEECEIWRGKGGMCATCYAWCNYDRDSSKGELTDVHIRYSSPLPCATSSGSAIVRIRNGVFWISIAASGLELKAIVWGGYLPEAGMMGELCICVSVLKIMMIEMSTRESACRLGLSGSFIFSRFWLTEVVLVLVYTYSCDLKIARTSQIHRT